MNFSLSIAIFLGLTSCYLAGASNIADATIHQSKTWCVVAIGAPNDKLQAFLDSTCSQLSCAAIRPGGSCFNPNTLQNHASYVLNLLYRARGACPSGLGLPSINDPSFGSCRYT